MGLALGGDRHPPLGQLPRPADHRHAALQPAAATSSAGSRSATTPGACTSTSASAAPTARSRSATTCASACRCCSRSPPTRRSSTARTPACTRSAPRSSPAPSRAAGSTSRSATGTPTRTSSTCSRATDSIVESTQLWWSVRPHHRFGTVEVRICDAQTGGEESFALAGLIVACVAQAALDYDDGRLAAAAAPARDRGEPLAGDPLRARRRMIDFERGEEIAPPRPRSSAARVDRAGARAARDRARACPGPNGAQRARAALGRGRVDRRDLPRRGRGDARNLRRRRGRIRPLRSETP